MSARGITEIGPWETWATDSTGVGVTWSLRPKGAKVAVITDLHHLDELEPAIRDYEREIDTHIWDARRTLDSYPEDWEGERAVQEALISALANVIRERATQAKG
jgi:hypothetical protein